MEQNDQMPEQQNNQPVRYVQISAKEFAAKYQSKRECYNFLAG